MDRTNHDQVSNIPNSPSPAWWWVLLATVPVVVRLLSKSILESGDGIAHYHIAAFSWQYPRHFFDFWGKPLFTLLASPFAQLGHWGMTLFNAVCFVLTAWAADGILKKAGPGARWLFPPVLLLVPVYGTMVIAGMTEVLFGLLTILAIRAAFDGKPRIFALIVSVMPFSRPEAIAFVPFAILWIAFNRHWKAIPFLLAGNVIFAILAAFGMKDPFWIWNGDPYQGAMNIYGSGEWDHFITHLHEIYGPVHIGALIALVICALEWRRVEFIQNGGRTLLLLTLFPILAIVLLHSWLWWGGSKGSLGLFRVMATTAPMLVLFILWPIYWACSRMIHGRYMTAFLTVVVAVIYLPAAASIFLEHQPLPVPSDVQQELLTKAGERVKDMME
ncbi:MAG: hypothetical protein M3R08_00655, partial [Bacteroidota bacterium]|nr:hypothetical protein [Bacteroidota bacterium]